MWLLKKRFSYAAHLSAAVLIFSLFVFFQPGFAVGQQAVPVVQEVAVLLSDLAGSGCEFYRNGSWYDGKEAGEHLVRKLRYVEKRTELASTEEFIEVAASKSSMSGKPYLVRCPGEEEQPSGQWLLQRLQLLRSR